MTSTTSRSVTVARDPAAVAEFVLDFTTSERWDPHTVSCRKLDDGPVAVGSTYESVQRVAGRESRLVYRVEEYVPGRRLVLEGGNDTIHTRDEIDVAPATPEGRSTPDGSSGVAGTTVTYTVHADLLGAARVGTPLLPALFKKIADDGEAHLRETLERSLPARP